MEAFEILLPLALILLFAKLMGLGTHRLGMPAVIGMLLREFSSAFCSLSLGHPYKTPSSQRT